MLTLSCAALGVSKAFLYLHVQAYITCVIGVHFVGYLMMTVYVMTGITAYTSGNLQQYIGRMPLILTGQFKLRSHLQRNNDKIMIKGGLVM